MLFCLFGEKIFFFCLRKLRELILLADSQSQALWLLSRKEIDKKVAPKAN
jgi:hypothetical protein